MSPMKKVVVTVIAAMGAAIVYKLLNSEYVPPQPK
jgi:hypothetical protein